MKKLLFVLITLCLIYGGSANAELPRFIDLHDGTVVDTVSKLRWLKNAYCFGDQDWGTAVSSGANLQSGACGLIDSSVVGDWHLPTIDELRIFKDAGYSYDTLNAAGFTGVQDHYYWSSSNYDFWGRYAWMVLFIDPGYVDHTDKGYYTTLGVWPVRGGQWSFDSFGSFFIMQTNPLSQNIYMVDHGRAEISIMNGGVAASNFLAKITGTNTSEFTLAPGGASPCPSLSPTLDAGTLCTLLITVTPKNKGVKNVNLNISNSTGSLDIPLTTTAISTINGTVTDLSTSNPLAGATIDITGGTSTQSDPSGNFIFDPQPANGVYTVTITKSGYGTATINNVIVSDTAGTVLKVGMTPEGNLNITTLPPNLSAATIGMAYSTPINITGGTGPFTFSTVSGMGYLPPGLTLDPSLGTISGSPTTAGSYTFSINVTDSQGIPAEFYDYVINVTAPLAITTTTPLSRGTVGLPYNATIAASGGAAPYIYAVSSGSLPTGLSLSASGIITGSPVYGDTTATFTVQITDSASRTITKDFTINVDSPLVNSTTRLNDGIVGTAFNQTLTAGGGLAPYTWGVYSGLLPAGLILDPSSGIITGTPTVVGSKVLVISVRDSYGRITFKEYTINIIKPMQILTTAMPNGFVADPYSEQIRLDGGKPPFSYSYTGALPLGLSLSNAAAGIISGTPTGGGLTNVTITVTDSTYPTAQSKTQNLSIRVWTALTITSTAVLSNAKKNNAITSVNLAAKGGTVGTGYTWSVVGGAFPDGITMSSTGIISGTPTVAGDYIATVRVTDQAATPATAEKQFFIHVSDTLSVVTGAVPDGAVDTPYTYTLSANGGLKNYTWAVVTGTLPAGLNLAPAGTISGIPTSKITSNVTVQVTDSDAPNQTAQKTYIFDVSDTLSIYDKTLSDGRMNNAYTGNIRAQLGTAPYSWIKKSGTLPPGTALTQNAGVATISGTPTAGGSYTFELEVSDNGIPVQRVARSYTINIVPELAVSSAALKAAVRTVPYAENIVATGGLLPYGFTLATGSLPTGLVLNSSSGTISGTITLPAGQSSTFTVRVTDAGSPPVFVDKQFTVFAIDPLVISTTTFAGALQKSSYGPVTLTATGGLSPHTWTLANATTLPQGLTLSSAGVISGTSVVCGNSFPFTVLVADSAPVPTTAQKAYTLAVTCSNDYDLAGTLGANGAGATVTLSGTQNKTASADASGKYLFQHLVNGSYTVTPSKTGFSFTPASRNVTINNMDMSGVNFTATDIAIPTISVFTLPLTSTTINEAVTITTDDNVGVTGWYLSENGTTPTAAAAGWASTKPASFTFAARGPRTLYLWVKDAVGNLSARSQATTTIDYQLTVAMDGTGGGSINSSPVGIAITSGSATTTYAPGTPVLLSQLIDSTSFFTRWNGACTNTSGNCSITMTGDKSVTATFTAADRARIKGVAGGYSSLNAAYIVATGGATINLLDAVLPENLIVTKSVILVGGFNTLFGGKTGNPTILDGGMTVKTGTVIVDGLAIR